MGNITLINTPPLLPRIGQGTIPGTVRQDIDRTDNALFKYPYQDTHALSHRTIYRLIRKVYVRRQDVATIPQVEQIALSLKVLAPKMFLKQVRELKYKETIEPPYTIAINVHSLRTREYLFPLFVEVDKW